MSTEKTDKTQGAQEQPDAQEQEAPAVALPDGQRVNWAGVDFAGLAADVETLYYYGNSNESRRDALRAVVKAFHNEFYDRLSKELKARNTAAWKQETFDRLKKELEQKSK